MTKTNRKKKWIEIESYARTSMQLLLLPIVNSFKVLLFFHSLSIYYNIVYMSQIFQGRKKKLRIRSWANLFHDCSLSSNAIMLYIHFYLNEYTVTQYRISFIIKFGRCACYSALPPSNVFSYTTIFIFLTYNTIDHPFCLNKKKRG